MAQILMLLQVHLEEEPGHVLVFLSGQEEIELAKRTLGKAGDALVHPRQLKILPVSMYAALSMEEQAEAYADVPSDVRKVILATNIAETSVTIPGVRYVIDSGVVKARAYSASRCMESLQVCCLNTQSVPHCLGGLDEMPAYRFQLYMQSWNTQRWD